MAILDVNSCVVDEKGTTIAYLDSGAIDGPYSTLVVVHGHTYHAREYISHLYRGNNAYA